jgi:hypothetical protein
MQNRNAENNVTNASSEGHTKRISNGSFVRSLRANVNKSSASIDPNCPNIA